MYIGKISFPFSRQFCNKGSWAALAQLVEHRIRNYYCVPMGKPMGENPSNSGKPYLAIPSQARRREGVET